TVVELVPVAMAFPDHIRPIHLVSARTMRQTHFLRAEAHRAAQIGAFAALLDRALLVLPLGDQRKHRTRGRAIELRGVRTLESGDIAGVLDDGELHPEADSEIRDGALARIADRLNLAVHAALAEAPGHQHRIHAFQAADAMLLDVCRLDELDVHAGARAQAGVIQRLGQRDV